jgi:mannose-6-phosphate isomerase class I
MEDKSEKDMEQKTLEVITLNIQVDEQKTSMQLTESELEDARTALFHSRIEVTVLESNLVTEQKERASDVERLEEEFKEKENQTIEMINQRNLKEGQSMLVDFEQGQKFLKIEIANLNKEYAANS